MNLFKYTAVTLLLLSVLKVFAKECVTYGFEEDRDKLFAEVRSCIDMPLWSVGFYNESDVAPPHPASKTFITPGSSRSCISSLPFVLNSNGSLEVYVYMDSKSVNDEIQVLVNIFNPGGNDIAIGEGSLRSANGLVITDSLQKLDIVWFDLVGSWDGYLVFFGTAAEESTIFIDSYRYIPPDRPDNECILYEDVETTTQVTNETDENSDESSTQSTISSATDEDSAESTIPSTISSATNENSAESTSEENSTESTIQSTISSETDENSVQSTIESTISIETDENSNENTIQSTISDITDENSTEGTILSTISSVTDENSIGSTIRSTTSSAADNVSGEGTIQSTISDITIENSAESTIRSTISTELDRDSEESSIQSTMSGITDENSVESTIQSTISGLTEENSASTLSTEIDENTDSSYEISWEMTTQSIIFNTTDEYSEEDYYEMGNSTYTTDSNYDRLLSNPTEVPVIVKPETTFWNNVSITALGLICLIVFGLISWCFYNCGRSKGEDVESAKIVDDYKDLQRSAMMPRVIRDGITYSRSNRT